LIVDDETAVRRVIQRKLSAEGYHCREAADADQALDELRRHPIELVLLDINMPGRSGLQLIPQIKELYPDTLVVMTTGVVDTYTTIQCIREGAFDYITKPLNLDELLVGNILFCLLGGNIFSIGLVVKWSV
jgi:DNA-binding NtrC family response regulator